MYTEGVYSMDTKNQADCRRASAKGYYSEIMFSNCVPSIRSSARQRKKVIR